MSADLRRRDFLQFAQEIMGQLAQAVLVPQLAGQVRGEVGGHLGVGHGPVGLTGVRQAGPGGQGTQLVVGRRRHQPSGQQQ